MIDKRTMFLRFLLIICFTIALFCPEAVCKTLCFKFQAGEKYELVSTVIQTTEQPAPSEAPSAVEGASQGQKQASEQMVWLKSDFDIVEIEEGGDAWVRYTFKRVAMKSGDFSFDSDIDVNRPRVPMQVLPLYAALGESFYIKVTPQGRIAKINGLPSIVGFAKGKVAGMVSNNQASPAIQVVENQFSETMIKNTLENQLAVFPDPCILPDVCGIGDTWSRIGSIGSDEESKVVTETTFRLKGRRVVAGAPVIAVIDVNIMVRPTADVNGTVAAGVKIIREVWGQGQGQIEIDESTGQIINERLVQDLVNQSKITSEGPVRRIPLPPDPTRRRIEMAFQMVKLADAGPITPDKPTDSNKP